MKSIAFLRLILLFGFFCFYAMSQAAFKPGIIFTSEGDTVVGFIDNQVETKMSSKCYFKTSLNNKATKYTLNDLTGFEFEKPFRHFDRLQIPYTRSNECRFLERIVYGRINLYYGYDAVLKTQLYLTKKDAPVFDLINNWEDTTKVGVAGHVKGILLLMADAPEMQEIVLLMDNPTVRNMMQLVNKYNQLSLWNASTSVKTDKPQSVNPLSNYGLGLSSELIYPQLKKGATYKSDIFGGFSVSMESKKSRNGLSVSAGFFLPFFNLSKTENGFKVGKTTNQLLFSHYYVVPIRAEYRFTNWPIQPLAGFETTFNFSNYFNHIVGGPYVGVKIHVLRQLAVSVNLGTQLFSLVNFLDMDYIPDYAFSYVQDQTKYPYTAFLRLHYIF